MDISSDLTELGRTPVTVICAGVKSILDIPKTLEYLVPNYSRINITEIILHALLIAVILIVFISNRKHKVFVSLLTRPTSFLPFSRTQVAARYAKFDFSMNILSLLDT